MNLLNKCFPPIGGKYLYKKEGLSVANTKKKKKNQNLRAWLFMLPALLLVFTFSVIPIIASLVLTLFDYSAGLGATKFVGLRNFERLFSDRVFILAMKHSIKFIVVVPIIQILSMALAVLVNRKLPGIKIFRTMFYIPVVTSMVAVSIIWGFLLGNTGVVNEMLKAAGLITKSIGFLSSSSTAMLCIMFIVTWQGLGYYMMMYLAGLQAVPAELIEAAKIDGATNLKTFIKITIPQLKPYIWFCSLNSLIAAIGVFDPVMVLTTGGPNNSTTVINYYSYVTAFKNFEFGYAASIGTVQAILTLIISIVVFAYGKKGGGMTNGK